MGVAIRIGGLAVGSGGGGQYITYDGVRYLVWTLPDGTLLRKGDRDGYLVVDQTLTALGFGAGSVENVDWKNIDAILWIYSGYWDTHLLPFLEGKVLGDFRIYPGTYSIGDHIPNLIPDAIDYLTIMDATSGAETFQCPNTAPYLAADTDNIWFYLNDNNRNVTTNELVGNDLQSTPVKYLDDAPNSIERIIILNAPVISADRNELFAYLHLSPWWDDSFNDYGYIKSNRSGEQILWIPEEIETANFLALITTQPDSIRRALINKTFKDLKTAGFLAKTPAFGFTAAHNSQTSTLNWKQDAHHLVYVNNPIFTADRGVTGNGSNSSVTSNFNPSVNNEIYKLDDASWGIYIRNNIASALIDIGTTEGTLLRLYSKYTDGTRLTRMHVSSADADAAAYAGLGFHFISRGASAGYDGYKNKVKETNTKTSVAVPNGTMVFMAGGLAREMAFWWMGSSLSEAEENTLYDIVVYYLTQIGA